MNRERAQFQHPIRGIAIAPKTPQLRDGKACKLKDADWEPCRNKALTILKKKYNNQQYSRRGKSAITFFINAEAKPKIRAALADAGYGCSYQEGITNMLRDLLEQQGRDSKI